MAKNNYNQDVSKLAKENENFRQVLFTTELSQLVLMSVAPGDDIGEETHEDTDQILSFVVGIGEAVIEGESRPVAAGSVVVVPAGTRHNFINQGGEPLKLYTIYVPPNHKDGTVHRTKQDALKDPNEQHEE
jgi:mannose-6-phosphate isomerase-like protein (cupin superfamily)